MARWIVTAAGILVAAAIAGVQKPEKPQPEKIGSIDNRVARGEYLVLHVAMCVQCHTPRNDRGELDRRRFLQGGPVPVRSPWPDQEWAPQAPSIAGLPGGWSEAQLASFLQTGVNANRRSPRPPMPPFRMTREDAASVAAYLKSLAVVSGVTTQPAS